MPRRKRRLLQHRLPLFVAALLIVILAPAIYFNLIKPRLATAAWFDTNWGYRQKVPISNTGSTQTDYQVMVTVDTAALVTAGKIQSDCDDIRFTNNSGKLLPFWIEPTTCNTTTTKVWVKVPTIYTATDIYLYYGNPSVAAYDQDATTDVFVRDMTSAAVAWPMDETSGSVAAATHPAVATGREMVIDTGFDDATKWTAGTGWAVTGGVGVATAVTSNSIYQSIPIIIGKSYSVTFTISNYSGSGTVTAYLGSTGAGTARSGNGTYTQTIVAAGTSTNFALFGLSSFTGSIDSVSVKQLSIPDSSTFTGTELLTDGNMEYADSPSSWTTGDINHYWRVYANATLSKQTTLPHSGSQLLRIAYNGNATAYANQSVLVAGKTYRITGYARSDGTGTAFAKLNSTVAIVAATTSNVTWNYFEGIGIADGSNVLLYGNGLSTDKYVEFDDVSVTEVSPMTGSISGATLNSASGDTRFPPSYSFDGSNDYVNIYSSDLNSAFNPSEGTLVTWAKVSGSGVWSDNAQRRIVSLAVDASNVVYIRKNTANQLHLVYDAGGTYQQVLTTTTSTSWFQVALTWNKSSDQVKAYFNGAQVDTTQTGLGTWSGNLSSTLSAIGAYDNTGSYSWSGFIADTRLYTRALSAAEITDLYGSATSGRQAYYTGNYADHELVRKYDTGVSLGSLATEETSTGPIAYWKFDEGTGTTTQDSTSKNHDGSISGATWITEDQCMSGKCLSFDGSNDVVTVSDTISGVQSVSFWVKPLTTTEQLIDLNGSAYIQASSGVVSATGFTSPTIYINGQASTTLTANTWNHVAVTTGTAISASAIKLAQISTNYGQVFMDEVKFYPYARTAAEIKADFNQFANKLATPDQGPLSNGLVGYWKMDETSGTSVADASGNGNTGTLTNAQETGTSDATGNSTTTMVDTDGTLSTTNDAYNGMILNFTATCGSITSGTQRVISDYVAASKTFSVADALSGAPDSCAYSILHQVGGKFGSGLLFDESNDYVNVTDTTATDVTLAAWINPESVGSTGVAAIVSGGGILTYPSVYQNAFKVYDGLDWRSGGSLTFNTWSHVALTFKASTKELTLYVNGVQGYHVTGVSTYTNGMLDDIGVWSNKTTRFFDGKIDEVRLYNRALSAAEVSSLYSWAPGPVAHYKFDEASGTSATDSSGNGLTASWNGTGTNHWVSGKYGNAAHLNGTDDYLTVGNNTILNPKHITIMAWFKGSGSNTYIVGKPYTTTGSPYHQYGVWFRPDNNKFEAGISTLPTTSVSQGSTSAYSPSQWNHVALTYDGTTLIRYVNGSIDATTSAPGVLASYATSLQIGKGNGAYYFTGSIDDVRIYNYARTPAQILQDMQAESSSNIGGGAGGIPEPLAHYKFDEQQGQTTNNSGNGGTALNGTLGATTGSSTDDPTWKTAGSGNCKNNGCLSFDGGDYVIVPGTVSTVGSGSVTDSAWIKTTNTTVNQGIYISYNGVPMNIFYILSNGKVRFNVRDGSGNEISGGTFDSTTTVNDGNWHRIVGIWDTDANAAHIYIDGVLNKSVTGLTSIGSINDAPASKLIGKDISTGFFTGSMDDVKIYSFALTADQVKQDYNQGVSMVMSGQTEAADLTDGAGNPPVAAWTFDEKTGTSAKDTSGNNNTGTLGVSTAAPTWKSAGQCHFGACLSFDGSNDYVDISSTSLASTIAYNGTYTFEAWVKTSATSGSIFNWYNSGAADRNGIILGAGKVVGGYYHGSYSQVQSANSIANNTWTHIAYTNSSGTNTVYVNGVASTTNSTTQSLSTNDAIGYNSNAGYFNGLIDHIQVYNYVRTPAQIAYDYNRGAPVAWYKLDECEGTTIHDASGNGNNATLAGSTTTGTCNTASTAWGNGASGKYNSSLSFVSSSSDYVSVANTLAGVQTVSYWVKPTTTTANMLALTSGAYVAASSGTITATGFTTPTYYVNGLATTSPTLTASVWNHIVVTTGTAISANAITFGKANSVYMDGQIDDVKIFNYALSATQVKKLMNEGSALRFGP